MLTLTFNIQDLPKWFMDDDTFRKNYLKGVDKDLEGVLQKDYKPAFVIYDQDNDSLTCSIEVPTEREGELREFIPLIGGKII